MGLRRDRHDDFYFHTTIVPHGIMVPVRRGFIFRNRNRNRDRKPDFYRLDEKERVCFWEHKNHQDEGALEEVESRIVKDWNKTPEAEACVQFMKKGKPVARYKGTAKCRVCGASLGCTDLNNDGWVYPEKWEHYITDVKPWNEQFIQDACLYHRSKS